MKTKKTQEIILKTKEDYNRIATQFDSTRKYNWPEITKLIEDIGIKPGSKVLDLGCGGGRLYEILRDKKIKYTGVDLSGELIKIAQQKYPETNFKELDITKETPDEEYDYIFSIAVLHHIPSKKLRSEVVNTIKSHLKKDGVAVISVWYFWHQWKFVKKIILSFLLSSSNFYKKSGDNLPFGDFYIPWKDKDGESLAQRYHHAWTAHELKEYGFKIISKKRNLIGTFKKS